MGWPVVLAGVAKEAPAGGREADGVDVVFQDAVLHVWKGVVAQRLLQEEVNQWGLEGLIAQFAQGLQDASDPQVVVLGPLKNKTGEAQDVVFIKLNLKNDHVIHIQMLNVNQ